MSPPDVSNQIPPHLGEADNGGQAREGTAEVKSSKTETGSSHDSAGSLAEQSKAVADETGKPAADADAAEDASSDVDPFAAGDVDTGDDDAPKPGESQPKQELSSPDVLSASTATLKPSTPPAATTATQYLNIESTTYEIGRAHV